ncbi:MAG: hypothetical protein V1838_01380, partial [Patescibacteria group bacterium]
NGISAASRIKVVGVGDDNAIIANSPGNLFGYIWIGASSGVCDDPAGLVCARDSDCNPAGGICVGQNDSIGWVSMSCANNKICEAADFSYGVSVVTAGSDQGALSGHAWIGDGDLGQYLPGDCQSSLCNSNTETPQLACNVDYDCRCAENRDACRSTGWISFDRTDVGSPLVPLADPFPGQPYIAKYDDATRKISGLARIMEFKTNGTGWIKFRGNNLGAQTGPFSDCADCSGTLSGGTGTCYFCNTWCGGDASCGNADDLNYSCGGDATTQCYNCSDTGECQNCQSCDLYGVSVNGASGQLLGYAWSEDYGWLNFNQSGYYSTAWLQTRFGDIYSGQEIGFGTTPPPGISGYGGTPTGDLCNATYLIQARGTIANFCSESDYLNLITNPLRGNTDDDFHFPSPSNQYTNLLGSINFSDIETIVVHETGYPQNCNLSGTCRLDKGANIFGDTVYSYTGLPAYYLTGKLDDLTPVHNAVITCSGGNPQTKVLNNSVYVFDGELYTGKVTSECTGLEFPTREDNFGAGMFIAKNKIVIDKKISYKTGNFNKLSELASVVFMSKESCIVFDQNTNDAVGVYYAGGTCNWPIDSTSNAGIHIVNPVVASAFELHGLLIAPSYKFNRTYHGTLQAPEPAEKIVYDGRLGLNPPQGLKDFTAAFPAIRQISP